MADKNAASSFTVSRWSAFNVGTGILPITGHVLSENMADKQVCAEFPLPCFEFRSPAVLALPFRVLLISDKKAFHPSGLS